MSESMGGGHGHEKKHDSHESHGGAHNEWMGNALKTIGITYALIAFAPYIVMPLIAVLPQYMTAKTAGIAAAGFFLGRKSNAPAKTSHGGGHGGGHGH